MVFLSVHKSVSHLQLIVLATLPIFFASPVSSSNSLLSRSSLSINPPNVQQDIITVTALTEDGATLGEGQVQDATAFALTVS